MNERTYLTGAEWNEIIRAIEPIPCYGCGIIYRDHDNAGHPWYEFASEAPVEERN